MNVFSEFHFLRPLWLVLVPVMIGIWQLRRRWLDPLQGWRAVMDSRLLSAMTVGDAQHSGRRENRALIAGLLAVTSLAGPTWKPEPSPFADDPVPALVLLKAGESMLLSDLSPSRMERARLKVADFALARKGQPLGLIAWAGSSHLVLPPTRDTSVVATMASEISPEIMPKKGDDLPAALRLAEATLGKSRGSIVIVADTIPRTSESALRDFAAENSLPVHILAIARAGTPELDEITAAASILGSRVTSISADTRDIDALVKATARAPVAVADVADGVRWSEAGWWLVPLLVLMSLAGFRRVENRPATESDS